VRRFTDDAGAAWEALVGKESFGTLVILFTPRAGGEPRKSILAAERPDDAERELDALSDDALRARLAESAPWR
jgi:hypothetical protein